MTACPALCYNNPITHEGVVSGSCRDAGQVNMLAVFPPGLSEKTRLMYHWKKRYRSLFFYALFRREHNIRRKNT